MQQLSERCLAAKRVALGLMYEWGLLPDWGFRFNNRVSSSGLRVYPHRGRRGRIELSQPFCERNTAEEVRDTVLHEIAHALAGPGTGHGPVWKVWCLKVGAKPQRCGEADMPSGRWRATCPSCLRVFHRHRKPSRLQG
jgi:hypothetical protein